MGVGLVTFPTQGVFNLPIKVFLLVVLAVVPTAIMGLGAREAFISLFSEVRYVGVFLFFTGVVLFLTRYTSKGDIYRPMELDSFRGFEQINWGKALVIGITQGLAIAPGISRSGLTISAGLFMGLNRNVATSFSFLLSIPTILGVTCFELWHMDLDKGEWEWILTAMGISYLVGILGLRSVLFFVRVGRLEIFSVYLWIVGLWAIWGRWA